MGASFNWGLRCGQMLAERSKNMNIIEQTSMWHRLGRMDEPPPEPKPADETLKTEVRSLRRGYSFLLKELNTLKEIRTPDKDKSKDFNILA